MNEGEIKCSSCGYQKSNKVKNIYALPPMTIIADRYVLGKVLGSGGFGVTYIAKDLLDDEICAIKEYLPFDWVFRKDVYLYANSDKKKHLFDEGKRKFLDEARVLNKFKNVNNVVHVRNFFSSNNTAYLVMEYLDGANFRTLINKQNGKVAFNIGQEIFLTVANALGEVHKQGVLHRDISPENIYITKTTEIKLIDFGSARQMVRDQENSMSIFLKPGYAPIEQYSTKGNQGPWTDIYALACTFYQSVTGVTVPDAPDRQKNDTLQPLSELCSKATPEWCRVIEKALSVTPGDRYQSINEMLEDLYLDTGDPHGVSQDAGPVIQQPVVPPSPPPPPPSPPPIPTTPPQPQPIPVPPPPQPAYIPPQPPRYVRPVIIILRAKHDTMRNKKIYLEPNREYCLGRSVQKSDIVVDMAECVSRQHCLVSYSMYERCFIVKDISVNGTFLSNGVRLGNGVFERIDPGTDLFLGTANTVIRLVIE